MRKRALLTLVLLFLATFATACGSQQTTTTTPEPEPEPEETAMVRFVHAIPDAQSADFSFAGETLAETVPYQGWSEWIEVPAGEQELAVRAGEMTLLSDVHNFAADERYLIVAYGSLSVVGGEMAATFLYVEDENVEENEEDVWVRFVNVVTDGDPYGLAFTTGGSFSLLFPNQGVGSASEYKRGPVYDQELQIIPASNTSLPPVHEFNQNLQIGIMYTFIAAGRVGNDTLTVIAVTDHQSLRD
ncbi:MAG: DUF4397 domain-containing protein [Myxococcales bacterium]|nr:DUF4397 domain-containing protein [Myxococcales bacterium]